MVLSINTKIRSISLKGYKDKSEVKTEINLTVMYDDMRMVNYVHLTQFPKGDIISLVVKFKDEDVTVDGKFNITGTRIDFLPENDISGNLAEVKYLI